MSRIVTLCISFVVTIVVLAFALVSATKIVHDAPQNGDPPPIQSARNKIKAKSARNGVAGDGARKRSHVEASHQVAGENKNNIKNNNNNNNNNEHGDVVENDDVNLKQIEDDEKAFDALGPFFFEAPKVAKEEKCTSNELLAKEKDSSVFFKQIQQSARVLCSNLRSANMKIVSAVEKSNLLVKKAPLTEYTGKFSDGTAVAIQHFQNVALPLGMVMEHLNDFTCESKIQLTNVKGEKFQPDWYISQDEYNAKANEADKQKIENDQHDEKPDEASSIQVDAFSAAGPVFRVDRAHPGNLLGNFEILFNIFLALKSVPSLIRRSGEEEEALLKSSRIVFKDHSDTIRWADMTLFRPFISEPFRDLVFEDTWKDVMGSYQQGAPVQKKQKKTKRSENDNDADAKSPSGAKSKKSASTRTDAILQFASIVEFSSSPLTSILPLSSSSSSLSDGSTSNSSSMCPSPIFQEFVEWFFKRAATDPKPAQRDKSDRKLRVLWASRGPSRDRYKAKTMHLPRRRVKDEMQFVVDLADELGSGVDLQVVDFGEQGLHQSLVPVRDADVLVGVHGAALTWSAFLPRGRAALVEVFTHDLLPASASTASSSSSLASDIGITSPYRKIAAWNGIEYASVKLDDTRYVDPPFTLPFEGEQKELLWTEKHVKMIADAIKTQLPFKKKLLENKKWCI